MQFVTCLGRNCTRKLARIRLSCLLQSCKQKFSLTCLWQPSCGMAVHTQHTHKASETLRDARHQWTLHVRSICVNKFQPGKRVHHHQLSCGMAVHTRDLHKASETLQGARHQCTWYVRSVCVNKFQSSTRVHWQQASCGIAV